ncbi:CLUMA_CG003559, isoform A [Clunio marinus]|uniref:CLUMA_CG003559, isoform A n=1 Tax=Clunio marinus TaxID=568069 RepID=A0A1J1HUB0_9DIPT|nr:CLUMA_CG003559, isoform A [Clunio marinus]
MTSDDEIPSTLVVNMLLTTFQLPTLTDSRGVNKIRNFGVFEFPATQNSALNMLTLMSLDKLLTQSKKLTSKCSSSGQRNKIIFFITFVIFSKIKSGKMPNCENLSESRKLFILK